MHSDNALELNVRGRSQILRVNYRTSHQIRRQADRLLPSTLADVDGVTEQRGGTISVFSGPEPLVTVLASTEEELACIAEWLRARENEGYEPHEIGVFVRSNAELERAVTGIKDAGLSAVHLSTHPGGVSGSVSVGTMHLAKGLEFRAVVVTACDDEVLPLQSRIENIADEADLEEVYNTERHLTVRGVHTCPRSSSRNRSGSGIGISRRSSFGCVVVRYLPSSRAQQGKRPGVPVLRPGNGPGRPNGSCAASGTRRRMGRPSHNASSSAAKAFCTSDATTV